MKVFFKSGLPEFGYMYVAGIYLHLNTYLADFTQLITNTLKHTNNCRTVSAGDFNTDVLSNSNSKRNYVDTCHQYGLINEINLPACASPSTGIITLLIDHLWHNLCSPRRSYVVSPIFPMTMLYVYFLELIMIAL